MKKRRKWRSLSFMGIVGVVGRDGSVSGSGGDEVCG